MGRHMPKRLLVLNEKSSEERRSSRMPMQQAWKIPRVCSHTQELWVSQYENMMIFPKERALERTRDAFDAGHIKAYVQASQSQRRSNEDPMISHPMQDRHTPLFTPTNTRLLPGLLETGAG